MGRLEEILQQEYEIVSVFNKCQEKTLMRLRHKQQQKDLILRVLEDTNRVYERLVGVRCNNLPIVYEAVVSENRLLVLEEFIDGSTVHDILQSGRYTPKGAAKVGIAVCSALEVLHEYSVIHRDIKPQNVMVCTNGDIKLIDLDAGRLYDPGCAGDTCQMGTVTYAAPEQYGVAQSDPRTDIFSLGVMLNVMITGLHPSSQSVTGPMGRIITKCVQMDPQRRYQTATQLKKALGRRV